MSQEDKNVEQHQDENAEAVADLEISSEQANEIQGGGALPTIQPFGGFQGGVHVAVADIN